MDKLLKCATAFEKLLNIRYRCVIGRKGKSYEFILEFKPRHFHHLAGLHKLPDIPELRRNRERVLKDVLSGKITYESICGSSGISMVDLRLEYLYRLEDFMDSNSIVFKYDNRKNPTSEIEAIYLLLNYFNDRTIYFFIDKESDLLFGRSFSPEENRDFAKGQTSYTLLYKEKLNIKTQGIIVQYDKLTPK